MSYNPSNKLQANIQAVNLALEWDGVTGLGKAQADVLKQFSGFGGLKAILYGDGTREQWEQAGATAADLKHYDQFMELHKVLKWNLSGKQHKAVLFYANNILSNHKVSFSHFLPIEVDVT